MYIARQPNAAPPAPIFTSREFHPTSTRTNLATAGFVFNIAAMDVAGESFVSVTTSPSPTDRPFEGLITGDIIFIEISGGEIACCEVTKFSYNQIHIRTHGTAIAQGAAQVITGGTDSFSKVDIPSYPKKIMYFLRSAGGKINGIPVSQTADYEVLCDHERTTIPHAFEGDFDIRITVNHN